MPKADVQHNVLNVSVNTRKSSFLIVKMRSIAVYYDVSKTAPPNDMDGLAKAKAQ